MLKNISKKKIVFLGLLLIIIFSIGAILYGLFKKLEKPQVKIPPPVLSPIYSDTNRFSVKKVELGKELKLPEIPRQMNVYSAIPDKTDLIKTAEELSEKFNLKKHSSLKNYWVNSDNSEILFIDSATNSVNYAIDGFKNPKAYNGSNKPTTEKAITKAQEFISSVEDWKTLVLEKDQISYLTSTSSEIRPSSQEKANLIEVGFASLIDNLSLRTSGYLRPALGITIGQEEKIVRFVYTPQLVKEIKSIGVFDTLPEDEIKKQITDGKGTVIDVRTERIVTDQAKVIEKTIISRTTLEYRYDSKTGLALPYLRFEGTAEVEANNQGLVGILLPLIDSKYFIEK